MEIVLLMQDDKNAILCWAELDAREYVEYTLFFFVRYVRGVLMCLLREFYLLMPD
jgi:hypothetical protein